jgi:predicted GIY-YIG superfamily endonuclease
MSFWAYILRCADNSYYTGHTDNLEKRIGEHSSGAIASCYTFKRRPLQLVFSQEFPTREEALASELQIKGWSRKKKEAMMRGDWAEVSRLAKSSTPVRAEPGACLTVEAHSNSVRPEPVEGLISTTVRPEPVEGPAPTSVRPEPVEGLISTTVRPEPVEGPAPTSVRPEPVEGRHSPTDSLERTSNHADEVEAFTRLRPFDRLPAQPERSGGDE